jgi:hypothetical protein
MFRKGFSILFSGFPGNKSSGRSLADQVHEQFALIAFAHFAIPKASCSAPVFVSGSLLVITTLKNSLCGGPLGFHYVNLMSHTAFRQSLACVRNFSTSLLTVQPSSTVNAEPPTDSVHVQSTWWVAVDVGIRFDRRCLCFWLRQHSTSKSQSCTQSSHPIAKPLHALFSEGSRNRLL